MGRFFLAATLACVVVLVVGAGPVGADEPLTCSGVPATIVASGGTTYGTDGPDVIVGTTGADTIYGLGGDDLICGAPDQAETADQGDHIYGGEGNDSLAGGGFAGEEGAPPNKLPDGNDVIDGGSGDDFATGMTGNDTVMGGNGNDEVFGGPGADNVSGGNGDDIVVGNFGNDTLTGDNGDDLLDGDIVGDDGPAQDPLPNVDTCDGGRGANQLFYCNP